MSIGTDYNSPYRRMVNEKNKLIDATIKPIQKPQNEKLCTFCRRDMMESYLRPPNRFIDENGIDNGGMKPNHWYFKCPTCGLTELMPTQPESNKKGYRTKNTTLNKNPMWLGEPGSPASRRRSKRPSGINNSEVDPEDAKDITGMMGYTPQSIEYRDSA